jgi:hypothetical protein
MLPKHKGAPCILPQLGTSLPDQTKLDMIERARGWLRETRSEVREYENPGRPSESSGRVEPGERGLGGIG